VGALRQHLPSVLSVAVGHDTNFVCFHPLHGVVFFRHSVPASAPELRCPFQPKIVKNNLFSMTTYDSHSTKITDTQLQSHLS
jgi:hypothetical protein